MEKDSPSSRTTKSSFFSRSAHFGNFSPFLVGATNTFSELTHPLVKLPNCVLKQQPHILPKRSALLAFSLFEEQAQALLLYYHFHSFLILHYIHYISQRTNTENSSRVTELQHQEQTITHAILPRNQLPSVSNSQRRQSCEKIFDSSTTFLNPLVGTKTHCMENGQSVFFLSPHTPSSYALRTRKTLTPPFTDFLTDFEKNRLFCSLGNH